MKNLRIILMVLALGMLGACTNTFVYNQLDWLVPWYVDDYVDLTRDQKQSLKAQMQSLLAWHRGQELASYIVIIDGIETDLQQPVTGKDVENWANQAMAAYDRLEARTLPIAFEIGSQLSDTQMREFIESLEEGQQELEEEYLERTDEEYNEDNIENFSENLGDFLGRLTPEQLAVAKQASESLLRFDAAWLTERRRWIDKLSGLLQREPGWQEAVMTALEERERDRSEIYRSSYRHNAVVVNDAIAQVLNLRTEKQSRRLQKEMDSLRDDLRTLIEQGESQ